MISTTTPPSYAAHCCPPTQTTSEAPLATRFVPQRPGASAGAPPPDLAYFISATAGLLALLLALKTQRSDFSFPSGPAPPTFRFGLLSLDLTQIQVNKIVTKALTAWIYQLRPPWRQISHTKSPGSTLKVLNPCTKLTSSSSNYC